MQCCLYSFHCTELISNTCVSREEDLCKHSVRPTEYTYSRAWEYRALMLQISMCVLNSVEKCTFSVGFFFFNLLTTEDYLQVILQSPPHQLSQRSLLQRDKYFLRCYFLPPRCLVARINQQFCLKCTSLSLRSSGLLS